LNGYETIDAVFRSKIIIYANFDWSPVDDKRQTFKTPFETDRFAIGGLWQIEEEDEFVRMFVIHEIHHVFSFAQQKANLSDIDAHARWNLNFDNDGSVEVFLVDKVSLSWRICYTCLRLDFIEPWHRHKFLCQ